MCSAVAARCDGRKIRSIRDGEATLRPWGSMQKLIRRASLNDIRRQCEESLTKPFIPRSKHAGTERPEWCSSKMLDCKSLTTPRYKMLLDRRSPNHRL